MAAKKIRVRFKKAYFKYAYSPGDIGLVDASDIPVPLNDDYIEVLPDKEKEFSSVNDYIKYGESADGEISDLRKYNKYLLIGIGISLAGIITLALILIF